MLATPGPLIAGRPAVPDDPAWVHEVKWDGVRVLARVRDGRLRLSTRTERDITATFPDLEPLSRVADDVCLDGEVVLFDQGRPSFARLAERLHLTSPRDCAAAAAATPVQFMVFDLLSLDGLDTTSLPWQARREALESLTDGHAPAHLSPLYQDGRELLRATAAQGLEGVLSKRRSSIYRPGVRSQDWLKFPHRSSRSVVVGGWRPETGRDRLGALLIGVPGPDGLLRFQGRVGSGLAGKAGAHLEQLLRARSRPDSPFQQELPRLDAVGARWVRPEVVVEVSSLGSTPHGRLRQPSYAGVRTDVEPEQLVED